MIYLITESQLKRLETVHTLLAREIRGNAKFEHQFDVDENYIMWGFRYALGRRTGAVNDVCTTLKRVWKDLSYFTREQIRNEIEKCKNERSIGNACDLESWDEILNLTII